MNARTHLVYHYLLTECLTLTEDRRKDIEKHWGEVPELCVSVPSVQRKIIIVPALAEVFDYDLTGVPGFYYDYKREYPCHWRFNIPENIKGIIRPYFDENNLIVGLFIFSYVGDSNPRLLSSKGLTLGSEAIKPSEHNRGVAA